MKHSVIGGRLDYAALARANRPRDFESIRAAIHELHARGLGAYDIAHAIDASVEAVRRVLGEQGDISDSSASAKA